MQRLTISKVAKQAGINLETIRYYEKEGVLKAPPRTAAGYRIFTEDAVDRLRFIKRAQDLGFSLKEIKELLALQVQPGASCRDVRARAAAKIADVDEKIRNLKVIRKALAEITSQCSGGGPLNGCSILQALRGEEK
jgi:MerR family transcriptional regulator, copper efflux regulator